MQKRVPLGIDARLSETRGLVDLTARELDRLAKTSEGLTSLIESGVARNPTMGTLAGLARVLGVSIDWLVEGVGKAPTARSVQAAVTEARLQHTTESGEYPAVDDRAVIKRSNSSG